MSRWDCIAILTVLLAVVWFLATVYKAGYDHGVKSRTQDFLNKPGLVQVIQAEEEAMRVRRKLERADK